MIAGVKKKSLKWVPGHKKFEINERGAHSGKHGI